MKRCVVGVHLLRLSGKKMVQTLRIRSWMIQKLSQIQHHLTGMKILQVQAMNAVTLHWQEDWLRTWKRRMVNFAMIFRKFLKRWKWSTQLLTQLTEQRLAQKIYPGYQIPLVQVANSCQCKYGFLMFSFQNKRHSKC